MSQLLASIQAEQRARAAYLPPCPLCSFIGVNEFPDKVRGPWHREFRGAHKLTACCSLSTTEQQFESQAHAAQWWQARRLEPLSNPALESRRLSTLAKLSARNLEPL